MALGSQFDRFYYSSPTVMGDNEEIPSNKMRMRWGRYTRSLQTSDPREAESNLKEQMTNQKSGQMPLFGGIYISEDRERPALDAWGGYRRGGHTVRLPSVIVGHHKWVNNPLAIPSREESKPDPAPHQGGLF